MHENNRKKERYSENEAASKLGVSIEQLRALVKRHISREDDVPSAAVFQPSDLVLLRILSNMQQNPASGI